MDSKNLIFANPKKEHEEEGTTDKTERDDQPMTEATPETEEEEAPQDDGGKEKEKMDVVESQVRFAIGTGIDLTIESIYSI